MGDVFELLGQVYAAKKRDEQSLRAFTPDFTVGYEQLDGIRLAAHHAEIKALARELKH